MAGALEKNWGQSGFYVPSQLAGCGYTWWEAFTNAKL